MAKVGGWHRWAGDQSGGWSIPSDASVESGLAASKLIGLTHSLLLNFDGEFVPALPLFQHAEVKQPLLREISVGLPRIFNIVDNVSERYPRGKIPVLDIFAIRISMRRYEPVTLRAITFGNNDHTLTNLGRSKLAAL